MSKENPRLAQSTGGLTAFLEHMRKHTFSTSQPHSKPRLVKEGSLPKISIVTPTKEHLKPIEDDEAKKRAVLWAVLASYLPTDKFTLQKEFVKHVEYTLAQTEHEANAFSGFEALALCTRDRLIERWKDTRLYFKQHGVKQVNYLSLEFLLGRSLQNGLMSLGLVGKYSEALMELGYHLEDLYEEEHDAGLGNGGLGRLAACFMDSLATMDYPACGYGLRYTYGMFFQSVQDGEQVELPDYWLNYGSPWEIERLDINYQIYFGGYVEENTGEGGKKEFVWKPDETIVAVAFDYPIPGYNTFNTINIRLWSAKPSNEFDLASFNKGDYIGSIEEKQRSENITNLLYPNDNTMQGKELRLRQQYFFVSATIQDIVTHFKNTHKNFKEFPTMHAIQLNDTHPTLGIPELMRILMDEEGLSWDEAWDITTKTFSYTNHTVLPEALERWSVSLFEKLLPRHLSIIYAINEFFLDQVEEKWPGQGQIRRAMSIIDESGGRTVRMAYLAIVGSHTINGVAELHTELIKSDVFPLFYEMWPHKFQNKTNGVTPRRWIHQCNPQLSTLITKTLSTSRWVVNLDIIKDLRKHADDPLFHKQWMDIKRNNKIRMAKLIEKETEIVVNVDALFDVHVKRFHEYKRQLLNILGVINRYLEIKAGKPKQPKVVIFGGKAAPGYFMAKLIIKLINDVAAVINNDAQVGNMLKIIFIPNYGVSNAEIIIPSSDVSEHISTAGTEASGTSNMKFSMNGGLIIGTLDGANIEIREAIGKENMSIFGAVASEIAKIQKEIHEGTFKPDTRWLDVITAIKKGMFANAAEMQPILDSITNGRDNYILSYDFVSYLDAQNQIDQAYQDKHKWAKMSILASAGCGKFSSDRSIREYAEQIWHVEPCRRSGPIAVTNEEYQSITKSPVGSPFDKNMSPMISVERLTPNLTPKGTGAHPTIHKDALLPKTVIKGFQVNES
ncbi:hypothetical protein SAMD00019534_072410 [Acytostelium subglobosum LB1]|uniref:hypothetical protein n=1 Tax=Acytostelium subglobosum LB1 TaxID=1410327 RepID=UPI000644ED55|nr:hypothetical protein SAMD00019534_072410 [Acytostelium subglobosum LB1]GAM24066.1 hypothetical protein SAMD00019534_072410 [Acytostelium subglobosum LB1]|eukprot:XP_012753102.1 hypothetical protein SAMD00019534_072410 [Acytostelium subglobosum LB1]